MAFFKVKEQRDALKWQRLIAAVSQEEDPTKLDHLQTLDFNDPEE